MRSIALSAIIAVAVIVSCPAKRGHGETVAQGCLIDLNGHYWKTTVWTQDEKGKKTFTMLGMDESVGKAMSRCGKWMDEQDHPKKKRVK